MKKALILLSLFLACLLVLSACEGDLPPIETDPTGETTAETAESTTEETTEAESFAAVPSMTLEGYDDPWYLSFDPTATNLQAPNFREFLSLREAYRARETEKRYFTKVPLCYEAYYEQDGEQILQYRVEFFKEYYEHDELLQVRITVTNATSEPQEVRWCCEGPGIELMMGGYPAVSKYSMISRYFVMDFHAEWELGISSVMDGVRKATLAPGESIVLERARALCAFTDLAVHESGAYTDIFEKNGSIKILYGTSLAFEIPIEMVVFDADDPEAGRIDAVP